MTDFAEFGIRADTSELDSASRKLRKLGDEGDKSEKRLSSSASKTAAAFGRVAGAIGLVTAAISAIGLKGSLGFEKSIKEVSTLVDGLEGDIDRISTASRRLSTEFGGSAAEQAKGFYQAISAGASNAAQATAVLETANRLAIGGVSDVASSVDILTTVMNTYGDQVGGAGDVSDALFVGMRAGKALDLDTLIPTPNGFVKIRHVKSGDKVLNEKGAIETVLYAHEVIHDAESYKITFGDGVSVNACVDHNWLIYTDENRRNINNKERNDEYKPKSNRKLRGHKSIPPIVKTTGEIIKDFKPKNKKLFKYRNYVQYAEPVQFTEQAFDIDPYILGLWLGDGATGSARISTIDQEIIESIKEKGYKVSKVAGDNCDYGVSSTQKNKTKSLFKQLTNNNLIGNKHIPEQYHIGSIDQRLSLLQGLMDTDGYVDKKGICEFCSVTKNLAFGVKRLVDSLGMRAKIAEKQPKHKNHKLAYRVTFSPVKYNPFRLERKRKRVKDSYRIKSFLPIVSIEKIDNRPMRCLTVTGNSSLFLVGQNFIVTHNTTITELSASLGKVVPLAAQLGISFDELVGATAALTKGGISTTESITGIRAVLAAVTKPSSEAVKTAKELGIEFNAAALASKGLGRFLDELKEATGGSSEELAKLFGGVEALIPIMALTGNIGDDLTEIMSQMANKVGETDKAFQKMTDDNQFKIDQFMSSVNNIALTLGGTLADVLAPAAQAASRALNDLFSETIQDESSIDVQRAKVQSLTEEIQHLTGLKGVLGIFGPNKAEFDKLEDQLEAAQEELARLERIAEKAALATRKVFSTNFAPVDLDQERRDRERKEREAARANAVSRQQLSEGQRFLESLKKQAAEAGKTGTELLRVRASIFGNTQEAEKYISVIEKKNQADEEQRDASRLLASDLREIDQITQSVASNQEKLSEELANLDRLRGITDETGKAVLSQQDYLRAVEQTKDKFRDLEREGISSFSSIEQFTIQAARNIQTSFADFLFDPFDEGLKGMIKGFANTLRRLVAESASTKILEATGVSQIFGSSPGSSSNSSGFSFTNAASLVSAGKTAFDLFNSGVSGITTSIASGLEGVASTLGLDTASSFLSGVSGSGASVFSNAGGAGTAFIGGQGTAIGGTGTSAAATAGSTAAPFIASAGLVAAAGIATQQLNDLIENNKKIAGISGDVLNAVINPISQIPIIGDFLPDFGGAITALFGRGKIKRKETNLIGDVTAEGFEGITSTKLKAEGGLFASDLVKRLLLDINTGDLAPGSTEKFPELAAQLKPLVEQFGENLDLSIQTLSKSLLPVAENIGTNDLSTFSTDVNIASEKGEFFNSDQILEELQRIEEEMIRHLVPSIDTLVKGGETISQAFQRIGSEFNTLAALGNVLGNSTETAKEFLRTVSVESRSAFIAQAGGQQALGSKIDFFADNFLTDAERLAPSIELVNKELLELGISSDITKEQFKELVQSYGKLGGVTEDTVIRLLNLAPAFVNVRDSSEEATSAVLDFADAQSNVTQLRSNLVSSYNRERSELQGVISEFDNLSNTLLSFRDRLSLGELSPLTPSQKLDEARQQLNDTRRLADTGDQNAIARIPDAVQSFIEASKTFNASGGTFDSDFAFGKSVLDSVGAVAQSEADIARLQLTELQSTVSVLTEIDQGVTTVDESIKELTSAVLTGLGNPDISDQTIRDVASDPNLTPQDLVDLAIKNNVSADQFINATGANPANVSVVTGGQSITDDQIREFVAATPDPFAIHSKALEFGISSERLASAVGISQDEILKFVRDNNLAEFQTGTDFVPNTGLALVHKGEAVTPSSVPDEIKLLREEIKQLREDQNRQTEALINVTRDSSNKNAQMIVKANKESDQSRSWQDRSAVGVA